MDQEETQGRRHPQPPPQNGRFYSILFLFAVLVAIAAVVLAPSIVHQIPEGHVGAYWKGGALLNTTTEPGIHLKLPFITQYRPVKVTLQTGKVKDIACGIKEGFMIDFDKIEVLHRLRKEYVYDTLLRFGVDYDNILIYYNLRHGVNKFCRSHSIEQYIDVFGQIGEWVKDTLQDECTSHAPGIEIVSVYVSRPKIPESDRKYYEQIEEANIKLIIAKERRKLVEQEEERKRKRVMSEAEKNRKQQEIDSQLYLAQQKTLAEANFYRVFREAVAKTSKLLSLIFFGG